MAISRLNNEGYYDPTAYAALTEIETGEREARGGLPFQLGSNFVYICSPYRGDVATNITNAQQYCRIAFCSGKIPIAPHLYLPQFLDDNNEAERKAGLSLGIEALKLCTEFWVCGDVISQGMSQEIAAARRHKIRIKHIEG